MTSKKFLVKAATEIKKIRALHGRKRAEYIWEYYKAVFGLIMVCMLVTGGIWSSVSKAQEKTVLSMVIIDADRGKPEAFNQLERELEDVLTGSGTKECVTIDTSATTNENPEAVMNMVMKLSVAEDHDAVVLNQAQWQRFEKEGSFAEWEEILGDSYPEYAQYIQGSGLLVSESKKWTAGGYVQYEPSYLCVLDKTERIDAVKGLVKYLFS